MSLIELSQQLYDSELGTALRESIYMFPIIEGLHLIGLAFSVGLLVFVDLRLLGIFLKFIPIDKLLHPLRPWILVGFLVTIVTGILLFVAAASKIVLLNVFFYKLIFIVLAGINAFWFEVKWGQQIKNWASDEQYPKGARIAGGVSLALWSLVVITGRLIPYLSYE